jgi:hypothetical protein
MRTKVEQCGDCVNIRTVATVLKCRVGEEEMGRLYNLPCPLPSFHTFMMRSRANAVYAVTRRTAFSNNAGLAPVLETALATAY